MGPTHIHSFLATWSALAGVRRAHNVSSYVDRLDVRGLRRPRRHVANEAPPSVCTQQYWRLERKGPNMAAVGEVRGLQTWAEEIAAFFKNTPDRQYTR